MHELFPLAGANPVPRGPTRAKRKRRKVIVLQNPADFSNDSLGKLETVLKMITIYKGATVDAVRELRFDIWTLRKWRTEFESGALMRAVHEDLMWARQALLQQNDIEEELDLETYICQLTETLALANEVQPVNCEITGV